MHVVHYSAANQIYPMTTPNNRRIQRDIHDLLRVKDEMGIPFAFRADELSHIRVNYLPTEGRYAGQPVHVHIDVPFDYPTQPLAVSIHTPGFTHPNVYSFGICLDMLKPPEHYAAPYTGWSAAYSLSSVIMQMYGFLMVDDQVEQMYGDAPANTIIATTSVSHRRCSAHVGSPSFPSHWTQRQHWSHRHQQPLFPSCPMTSSTKLWASPMAPRWRS